MSDLIVGSSPVVQPEVTYDAWYCKSMQTTMTPKKDEHGLLVIGRLQAMFTLVPMVSSTGQVNVDPDKAVRCDVQDVYAFLAQHLAPTATDEQKAVGQAVGQAFGALIPGFQAIAKEQGKI